jgi:hypothetical protein
MYCSPSDLKLQLGSTTDASAELMADIIRRSMTAIDQYCHRTFEAVSATRTYNRLWDRLLPPWRLYLDHDVLSVSGLINGNGQVIPTDGTGFWLQPRNDPPYSIIQLKSSYVWTFNTDGEIQVTGMFGSSLTAPADIKQACIRLAAYFYELRRSNVFDVTLVPGMGQITIPKGTPIDVIQILNRNSPVSV